MKRFSHILVNAIFFASVIFECCSQEIQETDCLENDLSPDDEPDDGIFSTFAAQLEKYTGLMPNDTFSVTLDRCENTNCIVNPNGTAIWDARTHLYSENMMYNNNGSQYTLDGCLCYSQDTTEYEECMTQVRDSMIMQLDTILVEKFKEIIESDCVTLFETNCVVK